MYQLFTQRLWFQITNRISAMVWNPNVSTWLRKHNACFRNEPGVMPLLSPPRYVLSCFVCLVYSKHEMFVIYSNYYSGCLAAVNPTVAHSTCCFSLIHVKTAFSSNKVFLIGEPFWRLGTYRFIISLATVEIQRAGHYIDAFSMNIVKSMFLGTNKFQFYLSRYLPIWLILLMSITSWANSFIRCW